MVGPHSCDIDNSQPLAAIATALKYAGWRNTCTAALAALVLLALVLAQRPTATLAAHSALSSMLAHFFAVAITALSRSLPMRAQDHAVFACFALPPMLADAFTFAGNTIVTDLIVLANALTATFLAIASLSPVFAIVMRTGVNH